LSKVTINSVGVIGLGLIGASILKDLKKHAPELRRYGVSLGREQKIAYNEQLIQEELELTEFVESCDLIIIATPIDEVVATAKKIAKISSYRTKGLIVTDVASVKESIAPAFKELSNGTIDFIPSHPMGGSEKSGYQASHGGLFRGKPWIICSTQKSESINMLEDVFKKYCGAHVVYLEPSIHDKYVAVASHMVIDLSHLLFDFISRKHPEALKIAGESFITTTRLASDNPAMISGIHEHNLKNIQDVFGEFLEYINQILKQQDGLNQDYFLENKTNRDNWLHYRNKQN